MKKNKKVKIHLNKLTLPVWAYERIRNQTCFFSEDDAEQLAGKIDNYGDDLRRQADEWYFIRDLVDKAVRKINE